MRIYNPLRWAVLLTLFTQLTACASLLGGSESPSVRLKIYPADQGYAFSLESVDGVAGAGVPILMMPGAHALAVKLTSGVGHSSCTKILKFPRFESKYIYSLSAGVWNGLPSVMLKSARGEILDSAPFDSCSVASA